MTMRWFLRRGLACVRVVDTINICILILLQPPRSTLFPYTTLFRSIEASCKTPTMPVGPSYCERRSPSRSAVSSSAADPRSEEHTSELQSHVNLVCRLLLEKKN